MKDSLGRLAHANQLIDDEPPILHGAPGTIGRLERLCSALTRSLPATGVGLSLLTMDNYGGGTIAASNAESRVLEELQFSLGEGPCIEAYTSRRPVLEPQLSTHGMRRWPGYAAAAQEQGVKAVFAFPLQIGAARAGALDVYRNETGSLTDDALAQAVTFAEVAMGLLVDGQDGAQDGQTSSDLDDALAYRLEVYQAQGMVMVDLGVGIDEAMARLRGHAYAQDRYISDVARDIVGGKLRLNRDAT
ncbi:GAF and ANTAR domain-containing protein [Pedococcus bigeumensis]|uniref:ANTAR domain-containing protein n=1 Tax=Pedococcus bigeumensis TaxID=433644 RepID=A0A502CX86_9MICO|nr:GAF and ANTAR domain-containing protein [Pedococcus bigeumensis]TPG18195.1 ANTAR domain-containing protein [Pedococcus bigeumensis]